MRAAWALTFALCLAACGPTTPTGGAAVRSADAGGAATTSAPLPNDDDDAWVLTIANNFRDCDPNAKTCSEQHTVASDGAWSIRKEPNPILADGKPVTSRKVMPSRDLDALQEIVTSEAFEGALGLQPAVELRDEVRSRPPVGLLDLADEVAADVDQPAHGGQRQGATLPQGA